MSEPGDGRFEAQIEAMQRQVRGRLPWEDDPGLRGAPAGRIESAARIVVHAYQCQRALDGCPICGPLYERTTDEQGGLDIAIADLEAVL